MSKYVDLYEEIDEDLIITGRARFDVEETLNWLDNHPQSIPAKEVERKSFESVVSMNESNTRTHEQQVESILRAFGVVVAPRKTNMEKLNRVVLEDGVSTQGEAWSMACYLDKRGVKAPETEGTN